MSDVNRFSIDIEEMSEERVLIPKGDYLTKISKADLSHAEFKKDDKTGYWYRLDLVLDIKDKAISDLLKTDSPKVFHSIMISTDKESEKILTANNPDLGALLAACDLKTKEANEVFIEAASDAQTQREFNIAYLKKIADVLPGYELLAKVGQKKHGVDPDKMINSVTKLAKSE